MKVICKTYYDGDGCCLETGVYTLPFGGWCLIQSSATTMDTYRLKNGMYNDMIDAFNHNQGDYTAAIADQKLTIGPTVLDYLDVFHCEAGADGFECYAYQPHWQDGFETDGYPRLGRGDVVRCNWIFTKSLFPAYVSLHELEGAASLVASLYLFFYYF